MLAKRKLGASYTELAEEFNVSKNTIIHLCQKFGLGGSMNPPLARTTRKKPRFLYAESGIPVKNYADYLEEEKQRKWRDLTSNVK